MQLEEWFSRICIVFPYSDYNLDRVGDFGTWIPIFVKSLVHRWPFHTYLRVRMRYQQLSLAETYLNVGYNFYLRYISHCIASFLFRPFLVKTAKSFVSKYICFYPRYPPFEWGLQRCHMWWHTTPLKSLVSNGIGIRDSVWSTEHSQHNVSKCFIFDKSTLHYTRYIKTPLQYRFKYLSMTYTPSSIIQKQLKISASNCSSFHQNRRTSIKSLINRINSHSWRSLLGIIHRKKSQFFTL